MGVGLITLARKVWESDLSRPACSLVNFLAKSVPKSMNLKVVLSIIILNDLLSIYLRKVFENNVLSKVTELTKNEIADDWIKFYNESAIICNRMFFS